MKIYREGTEVFDVKIDKRTTLNAVLMGDHRIDALFIVPSPIDIRLGDYVMIGVEKYYLNRTPNINKLNNLTYEYSGVFEAESFKLFNKIFMDERSADFSYFEDLEGYLELLITNMNSIDPGWSYDLDGIPATAKPMQFSSESCRQALTRIAEEFKAEFRFVQKNIIVRSDVGFNSTYQFEYGRGKGLYSLSRNSVEEKGVVTRLYGFGGSKNLAFDYRDRSKNLVFETGDPAKRYLEANTELYGIREGVIEFEDIYPNRTGEVSALVTGSIFKVIDSSLDFNINDYLLEGQEAKIVFKTGALAGYEFPITAYDHATKQITFGEFVDSNDYKLPNSLNFPEIGDLYTLVNIKMPQAYIDAAEAELLAQATEYFATVNHPRVTYTLGIDEKFMRTNGVEIGLGMRVGIRDTALGVEDNIRIYQISFPLVNPKEITAQIADNIPYTVKQQVIKEKAQTKFELIKLEKLQEQIEREAVIRIKQLIGRIYDPDGYFDPVNIKPGSIETLSLTVGANSQNFGLNGVLFQPNFETDPNRFHASGGKLVHYEIEIPDLGYIWEMDPLEVNTLESDKAYYVYARCNKSALTGTWVLSEAPLKTDVEVGFYHFWVGILYEREILSAGPPIVYGQRYFFFTKGITSIIGDTIRTGRIESFDGLVFLSLSEGKFKVGNSESWMDWGVTAAGQLTINGAIVTKMFFTEDAEIINLKVNSLRTAVNGKRLEILADDGGDPATPLHNLKFYDEDGNLALTLDTNVDTDNATNPSAGMRIEKNGSARKALITQNGIMSSGSFLTDSNLPTNQHYGSILGILKEKFTSAFGIRAGVLGMDATNPATGNPSYGGWFNTFFGGGMNIGVRQITANYTATLDDTLISCYNSSPIGINLPANPRPGKWILVRTNFNVVTQINGNGNTIWVKGGVSSIAVSGSSYSRHGRMHMLIWDGTYWLYNALPAVGTD